MTELRKGLPPLPRRMAHLPINEKGYPIPYFVAEVDGKRDFRIADADKRVRAVRHSLCWLCGDTLGRHKAFVIGPMCAINRNTSEPPCHRECAEFAVQACPFLILPKAQGRIANLPEGAAFAPGMIAGNPGACAIWITDSFKPYRVDDSWLIRLSDPLEVTWWCEGRPATREDIMASIERRLPALRGMAQDEGPDAVETLRLQITRTMGLLPA
jgi:hypothetical protein